MSGIDRITAERHRQMFKHRWTPEHDDEHTNHDLAWAAVSYAAPEILWRGEVALNGDVNLIRDTWPDGWHSDWDKRPRGICSGGGPGMLVCANELDANERIRSLEKAGALIAAEIDRLERVTTHPKG